MTVPKPKRSRLWICSNMGSKKGLCPQTVSLISKRMNVTKSKSNYISLLLKTLRWLPFDLRRKFKLPRKPSKTLQDLGELISLACLSTLPLPPSRLLSHMQFPTNDLTLQPSTTFPHLHLTYFHPLPKPPLRGHFLQESHIPKALGDQKILPQAAPHAPIHVPLYSNCRVVCLSPLLTCVI